MKIENFLLTEQDIRNIELKERIDRQIDTKIQIEYINLRNQQSEKYNINYEDLSTSESNKYGLKRLYNNHNRVFECLFFGGLSLAGITLTLLSKICNGFEIQNMPIFIIWIISSIIAVIYGFKCLTLRRKIKKNFKELGLKIRNEFY